MQKGNELQMISRKDIASLHLPHNKNTASCVPIRIETPEEVVLPMNMHFGHDAEPIVSVGSHVHVGQLIAREEGRFSSPVHATVSGTVAAIEPIECSNDEKVMSIRIKSDGLMEKDPSIAPHNVKTAEEFIAAIRDGGIVGLGGAAFPTWAKFNEILNPEYKVDTILINAAECEPYITSDHRMMLDHPDLIVKGVNYIRECLAEYLHNATFNICIEKNKPDAIAVLKKAFKDYDDVVIQELNTVYPQGAKQVMLYNAAGRVAVAGRRFPSFGALIINVSSLAKTAEYLSTGMPLVERIVTVDGTAVKEPVNLIVPIGTRISELLKYTSLKGKVCKAVIGGPMNGYAVCTIDSPIVKAANCVLLFDEKTAELRDASACIRCGRCVFVCPININVAAVEPARRIRDEQKRVETLINTGVRQCIDCASCSYVCPANRPLLGYNREAKQYLKQYEYDMTQKERRQSEGEKTNE